MNVVGGPMFTPGSLGDPFLRDGRISRWRRRLGLKFGDLPSEAFALFHARQTIFDYLHVLAYARD
jgi:hypothetical protein